MRLKAQNREKDMPNINFNLPTSIPARQILPTAINKTAATVVINTPVVSTKIQNNFDPLSTVIDNNKFMTSLNRLNEPISRLQDLGATTTNMVKQTIENLIPINPLQQTLSLNINGKFNQATSSISLALSNPILSKMNLLSSIPNSLNSIKDSIGSTLNTSGLNLGNSSVGLATGGLLLCGVMAGLMKLDIGSFTSQLLQMQRTALAKLDKAKKEILNLIKKPIDKFLSFIPKVDIPQEIDKYAKMIESKYKSIVGQISKFTSKLDGVLKNASDCAQALNTVMGMVGTLGGLFGLNNVLNCSNVRNLTNMSNLGNIGNVHYEIHKVFPELVTTSMYEHAAINREVANKDLEYSRIQYQEELEKQQNEINNQIDKEMLDPSLDEAIADLIDNAETTIQKMLTDIQDIIDEIERRMELDENDPEYISKQEGEQAISILENIKEKLTELLEAIKELEQLPDSNRDIIENNGKLMEDLIQDLNDEIQKVLDEQQQNIDDIYTELETNAESVDAHTITEEPVDTSCKT